MASKKPITMRLSILIIIILSTGSYVLQAQSNTVETVGNTALYNNTLDKISIQDSLFLSGLPELPVPDHYKGPNAPPLPYKHDNSVHECFRPAYQQASYSCGQAALVGYNFTYEINRVRELPGDVSENQYPTHFAYNIWNRGVGGGVSYFTTMEVLKYAGTPTVEEYGGMSYGGDSRWIDGYDNYYEAMQNRISTAYSLNIGTEEGIQTLKHYLYDHLEDSEIGGVASFYANQPGLYTLEWGNEEGGKKVVISWSYSSHALTIVGWNDSIRWDYNLDGEYTNHIDINDDGIVDVRDWEIGGFKFVNSYGGVPEWGDDGFAYMMYKTVADAYGQGGIWNNTVNILKVKEDQSPQLTAKIKIKHSRRKAVKVMLGYANDTSATQPDAIFDYPVFNYLGGDFSMQGGSTEEDKILEFGIDISHMLSHIESGAYTKFFLSVNENDPENWGSGMVMNFSIMDYSDGVNETASGTTNIVIPHNGTVTLTAVAQTNHDEVVIEDVTLPPAQQDESYAHQLTASGGQTPYFWEVDYSFTESTTSNTYLGPAGTQLTLSNDDDGSVVQPISFSFPFYGEEFDTIHVHADGFLKFDDNILVWPYFQSEELLFKRRTLIAGFMSDLRSYPSENEGIWFEEDESGATFYWKTSISGEPGNSSLNFAIKLFPNGDIRYHYGTMEYGEDIEWYGGTSKGNSMNFQFLDISGDDMISENNRISLLASGIPAEMSLSEDGLFSGIPEEVYNGLEIKFKATDNNNVSNSKVLIFTSSGLVVEPEVVSGDDEVIEYAENVNLSITLTNLTGIDLNDAEMSISIPDPYFYLIDSTNYVGDIPNGDTVILADAFNFDVMPTVPNQHTLVVNSEITSGDSTYFANLIFTVLAPDIARGDVLVEDEGNNLLDPGETTDITIELANLGDVDLFDINLLLSSEDELVELNTSSFFVESIFSDSSQLATFNISVDPSAINGDFIELELELESESNYSKSYSFILNIGMSGENFENGNFNNFSWGNRGIKPWIITGDEVYEGSFSAQSGPITHNEESSLILDIEVTSESDLNFYRKVSCDNGTQGNTDYLAFLVDDTLLKKWNGELNWGKESFTFVPGNYRLEWVFLNNASTHSGQNSAWIDSISFPPGISITHNLDLDPGYMDVELKPGLSLFDTLSISNPATFGEVDFEIYIDNTPTEEKHINSRSILGSHIVCSNKYVNTAENFAWEFMVYNASGDNEWIKDILLYFPEGFVIDSVMNFTGGSGGELVAEIVGGDTVHWNGEDDSGWGVLKGSETALATVYGSILPTLTADFSVSTELHGDVYGEEPHSLYSELNFINLGEQNNWLVLDTLNGTIDEGLSINIPIAIHSDELDEGIYACDIIVLDNFNNVTIIPIDLLVDITAENAEIINIDALSVYPNPANKQVIIRFNGVDVIELELYSLHGALLSEQNIPNNSEGTQLEVDNYPPGIYFLKFSTANETIVKKILIR